MGIGVGLHQPTGIIPRSLVGAAGNPALRLPGTTTRLQAADVAITLNLPAAFKRRGVETKIVLPQAGAPTSDPDTNLIRTIALGYKWFAEIKNGAAPSISELAVRHGVDQGDVSRVIRFGLLAPDIVEAIIEGRQPVELTAARLKSIGELPIFWQAQRRVLGFG